MKQSGNCVPHRTTAVFMFYVYAQSRRFVNSGCSCQLCIFFRVGIFLQHRRCTSCILGCQPCPNPIPIALFHAQAQRLVHLERFCQLCISCAWFLFRQVANPDPDPIHPCPLLIHQRSTKDRAYFAPTVHLL